MQYPRVIHARVHRFGDAVAVSLSAVDGSGRPVSAPTFYLPHGIAAALAVLFSRCSADVAARAFTDADTFPTSSVDGAGRIVAGSLDDEDIRKARTSGVERPARRGHR